MAWNDVSGMKKDALLFGVSDIVTIKNRRKLNGNQKNRN